jgi:hypothetical protein
MELAMWGRAAGEKTMEDTVAAAFSYVLKPLSIRPDQVRLGQKVARPDAVGSGRSQVIEVDLIDREAELIVFQISVVPDRDFIERVAGKRQLIQRVHPEKKVSCAIITMSATARDMRRCESLDIKVYPGA